MKSFPTAIHEPILALVAEPVVGTFAFVFLIHVTYDVPVNA